MEADMKSIERKAYAKINLCLDVLRRREDGYHDVRMIMQTVDLFDTLTFEINPDYVPEKSINQNSVPDEYADKNSQICLIIKNVPKNADLGPVGKNLIYKAAKLVLETYNIETGVTITLEKNIPVAAGMAGGSTDAAAVFHGLNDLLSLGMTINDMCILGVKIGADVPYCILGGTALSEGIGEVLTPLVNPPECYLLIAKPDIDVSTKYVYENLHANELKVHPDVDGMKRGLLNHDLTEITAKMENVLETVTTVSYPMINDLKKLMKEGGAMNSLMSGSGPTVFGVFEHTKEGREMAENAAKLIKERNLAQSVFVTGFH